jgi:ABC-type antimicrobial peptide transport system permease subunit
VSKVALRPNSILLVGLVGALSTLVPALLAERLQIIEALRSE